MRGFPFPHTSLGENPAPGQRNKHPSSAAAHTEQGAGRAARGDRVPLRTLCPRPAGGLPPQGPRSAEPAAAGLPVPIAGGPGLIPGGRGCWQRGGHRASCEPCPGEAACQCCRWFEGKSKQPEVLTRV